MKEENKYDVIIIGGSYAGLSAAMSLGRSLRQVLIIDDGKCCNSKAPHAHNFITNDGKAPQEIAAMAREELSGYNTVQFKNGLVETVIKGEQEFEVKTATEHFFSRKILFATGIKDILPGIEGFADCWGISILFCPYCHGYEIKGKTIGLLGNGKTGFGFCSLISNWSSDLILFTNGPSTLTAEQQKKISARNIKIVETGISSFKHEQGQIRQVVLQDGTGEKIDAVFADVDAIQQCAIPEQLGCEMIDKASLKVDACFETTVPGVYAAGDNTKMFRALTVAIGQGTQAGAHINKALVDEDF